MEYNNTPSESPGLVSSCCGGEYTDFNEDGSECCGAKIINSICSDEDCLEHAETYEGYICEVCKEDFDTPEEETEYNERMRENAMEEKADAKRKYNE